MRVYRRIAILTLFAWMLFLHFAAHAATGGKSVDLGRLRAWSELKSLTLEDFMTFPDIKIKPYFFKNADLPQEMTTIAEYKAFEKILASQEQEKFESGFVAADKLARTAKKSDLTQWVLGLKADLMYQTKIQKDPSQLAMALEEYEDAARKFPLHPQMPRLLYQMGLINLQLGLFKETEEIASRSLKEYGLSEFAPDFLLLRAESHFQSKNLVQAMIDFTKVIEEHPRSLAAVDAAFRKALVYFRKRDYESALKTYENLEKYHSEAIEELRMRANATDQGKYVDRAFYGETLYLSGQYEEAARIFQDLSNLFPKHEKAPLISLRFADTYYERGQFRAAESLYRHVIESQNENPLALGWGRIKLADLLFLTKDVRVHRENEKLYDKAYSSGIAAKHSELAALALARLSEHFLNIESFPKAQQLLRDFIKEFPESRNIDWVNRQYVRTLEIEIKDYYVHEDYMAALATYLMADKDKARSIKDTRILLSIAEGAKRLSLYDKTADILNQVIYLEKTAEGRQEALLRLMDVLIVQGDYKRAAERLRRFNFAYPVTPLKYLYNRLWGDLYTKLKNPEKAVEHYELALEQAKDNPAALFEMREIRLTLAEHYQGLVLPIRAVESYNAYIKQVEEAKAQPLSGQVLQKRDEFNVTLSRFKIADIYFSMNDYVRALEAYRSMVNDIKEEPFSTHAQFRIGECLLMLEDRTAAIAAFKQVKSVDPNNLWMRAADSYMKTVELEVKYGIKIFN